MKFVSQLLLALAMVASATCEVLHMERVPMEASISAGSSKSFVRSARLLSKSEETVSLTFSLKHCPMKKAAFEGVFEAVSTPGNPMYKQYLNVDQVTEMLAPEQESVDAVVYLLAQYGITEHSINRNRDMITAEIPVHAAEKMFETELAEFEHATMSEHTMVRATKGYSLPAVVAEHVAFVEPLLRFPYLKETKVEPGMPRKQLRGAASASFAVSASEFDSCAGCTGATTPQVLQARYGFDLLTEAAEGNGMAVAEFQGQGTTPASLSDFSQSCGVPHVEIDNQIGSGSKDGVEALLDVQYIEAVASPIPLTDFNMFRYSLLDWATAVNDDDNAAPVHSVSYGNDEAQQTSTTYMDQCNTEFQKMGVRGLSVLFASGDQGVWGREGMTGSVFHPDFPGASPYITTVGGTEFATEGVIGDETTWEDGGGGFSDHFQIPDYQTDVVAAYLNSDVTMPDAAKFTATGRAYPDVSALAGTANGYCVYYDGTQGKVGGTSAASPVFAAVIAQLNDKLLAAGKPALGFLNPWIYQTAAQSIADGTPAFNDVTTGQNNAGDGQGFEATTGWDPATGHGTPNVPVLMTYLGL